MTITTYNGYESYNHWGTALWLNNDESLYNLLQNKVELAVYNVCSRQQAIIELIRELQETTGDSESWNIDTIEDLFDESYNEQLQYS